MTAAERRRHPRVRPKGVAAHVRGEGVAFSCPVENVSEGGAFLRTDHRLSIGSEVTLDLVKPGGRKALRVRARIARAVKGAGGHPGVGIEFTSIGEDDRRRLATWLQEEGLPALVATRPMGGARSESAPPAAPQPARAEVAAAHGESNAETAKLMFQIKGLLLQIDELRVQLHARDVEVEELRNALATARQQVGEPKS